MKTSRIVSVERKHVIPMEKIIANFKAINNVNLTFGVHSEDDGEHTRRDQVQNMPKHKQLYNNGKMSKPMGNAALLSLVEKGFETDWYKDNGENYSIKVYPRPILAPMIDRTIRKRDVKEYLKLGLGKQLVDGLHTTSYATEAALSIIGEKYLSRRNVSGFVGQRGGKYWGPLAKHNNPLVAKIKGLESMNGPKYNDYLETSTLGFEINEDGEEIYTKVSYIKIELGDPISRDTPLRDSGDLLKSIKVKVNRK